MVVSMCDGVSTRVFLLVSTHWFVNMSKEVGASHGDDSSEFALPRTSQRPSDDESSNGAGVDRVVVVVSVSTS